MRFDYEYDEPRVEWQCPCDECCGIVRFPFPEDPDDSMMEPEHPENVPPEKHVP